MVIEIGVSECYVGSWAGDVRTGDASWGLAGGIILIMIIIIILFGMPLLTRAIETKTMER